MASAVSKWMDEAGLQLAGQKTEAVLISRTKTANIRVGDHTVTTQRELKYLGVVIDDKLSFKGHVEYAHGKAARACTALSRMMPNVGGPKSSKRRLLTGVTTSVYEAKRIGGQSIREIVAAERARSMEVWQEE